MNNILISNPFLFRPCSPLEISEEYENFKYQATEFEKAWKAYQSSLEDDENIDNDSGVEESPKISFAERTEDFLFDDNTMEGTWLSAESFNFENIEGEGDIFDATDHSNLLEHFGLQNFGNDLLNDNGEIDMEELFGKDIKECGGGSVVSNEKLMLGEGATTRQTSTDLLETINLSALLSSSKSQMPVTTIVNAFTVTTDGRAAAAVESRRMPTRSSHQRKSAVGNRVVAPSPYHGEDVKPNVAALGINNGQSRNNRKRNASSISSEGMPSSSTQSAKSKQRKYEIEDPTDPSVRNAKAAKMNRDKKKQEFLAMKIRAETAETKSAALECELEKSRALISKLTAQLNEEVAKNRTATGLSRQMTTIKHVFEAIIPALSKTLNKPVSVEVPESFANIPAVLDENGELVSVVGHDVKSESFDILDGSFETTDEDPSDYFSFHVNSRDGKIRLDYDPSKLIEQLKNAAKNSLK